MAAIIDGSTYKGFWKLTGDHTFLAGFQLIPKHANIDFTSTNVSEGSITYAGNSTLTDADTIDENGNALNTSAKVAQYLSDNR